MLPVVSRDKSQNEKSVLTDYANVALANYHRIVLTASFLVAFFLNI